jgi:signal transduction histidine kinase
MASMALPKTPSPKTIGVQILTLYLITTHLHTHLRLHADTAALRHAKHVQQQFFAVMSHELRTPSAAIEHNRPDF